MPSNKRKHSGPAALTPSSSSSSESSSNLDDSSASFSSPSKRTKLATTMPSIKHKASSARRDVENAGSSDQIPSTAFSVSINEDLHHKSIKKEAAPLTPPKPKAPKSRKTLDDSPYNDIVYLKIGPEEERVGVHKPILTKSSSFFRSIYAAPHSPTPSSDVSITTGNGSKIVHLPTEDPDIFKRYIVWLYSSTMLTGEETYHTLTWATIISVYIFATKRSIAGLQNACIDATIRKQKASKLLPKQEDMNRLWKGHVHAAQLRQLFLHLYAAKADLETVMSGTGSFHGRFLSGMVSTLYRMKKGKWTEKQDFWKMRERYYVHGEGNPLLVD